MTTIAAKVSTGEIASDSMCSGEGVHYLVSKLQKGSCSVFGGAGNWDSLLKLYARLGDSGKLGALSDEDSDVEILELRADGLWVYDNCLVPARIKNDFYAIGTGAAYAIAGMHLGLSPEQAVRLAAVYDPLTRGPFDVMRLTDIVKPDPPVKPKKKRKRI